MYIGNFGKVYKASLETTHSSIPVAVKSVKYESDKEKEDFMKEMGVMSTILHPNIVRLYGLVLEGII